MDEVPDPGDDEPSGPLPPATAFGLPASPAGCGLLGAIVFALLLGPEFALLLAPEECGPDFPYCVAGPPRVTIRLLALVTLVAALFGLATAGLVRRRRDAAAAGRAARPPLWVGFVAMLILAMLISGWVLPLLLALMAG
jgi:hypothetical protein